MRAIKILFVTLVALYCVGFAVKSYERVTASRAPPQATLPKRPPPRWVTEDPAGLTGDDRLLAEAYRLALAEAERDEAQVAALRISQERLRSSRVRIHLLASRGKVPLSWTAEDNQDVQAWWWFQCDREGNYVLTPGVHPRLERP